jgi:hypothetical protein
MTSDKFDLRGDGQLLAFGSAKRLMMFGRICGV